jgi:2-keto-4-pentenoate hydratase
MRKIIEELAGHRVSEKVADALYDASTRRQPVSGLSYPRELTADIGSAYAIQYKNIHRRINQGAEIVGHKVGLTSKAMQDQLGVEEPDSGILLDDMVLPSGSPLIMETLLRPRIEAEFGIEVAMDLHGPRVAMNQIEESIGATFIALEVIDTRYPDWTIGLWESIADNASSGCAIVGNPSAAIPVTHLKDARIDVIIDGELRDSGLGSAVLGDPVESLLWLSQRLSRIGMGLHKGDIVLTGSVHASIDLRSCAREIVAISAGYEEVKLLLDWGKTE